MSLQEHTTPAPVFTENNVLDAQKISLFKLGRRHLQVVHQEFGDVIARSINSQSKRDFSVTKLFLEQTSERMTQGEETWLIVRSNTSYHPVALLSLTHHVLHDDHTVKVKMWLSQEGKGYVERTVEVVRAYVRLFHNARMIEFLVPRDDVDFKCFLVEIGAQRVRYVLEEWEGKTQFILHYHLSSIVR